LIEWNKGSITLENGSKLFASATSGSAIRGSSISLLYIDEAAFVENWAEFFTSVYPTITSGKETKVLMTSTPNGLNHIYKLFQDSIEGRNNYKTIHVPWHMVPGRDQAWADDCLKGLGGDVKKFQQEFEASFQGSSSTLIDSSKLAALRSINPSHFTNDLSIFKEREEEAIYNIIVDVSRGKGLDYSAFSVIRIDKMPFEQVSTYRSNQILPTEYAQIILESARYYNDAFVLVEINDIGGQVADLLVDDFGYENVLFTESDKRTGKKLSFNSQRTNDRGIRTSTNVKANGCAMLKILIEQDQLIINDTDTIEELYHFVKKGRSYEAENGSTDDMVMGLVLFGWGSNQDLFKEITNINALRGIRDRDTEALEMSLPLGWLLTGVGGEDSEVSSEGWVKPEDFEYF
jgi:hypothetical protein